jgi:septal ring-binding cell division protein DamX
MRYSLLTIILVLVACSSQEPLPPGPAAEAKREAPSDWDCTRTENDLWSCQAPNKSVANPIQQRTSEDGVPVAMQLADYVLQVGAFRDRERAIAAARDIDRKEMIVLPMQREGEQLFVLVLGVYPTLADAEAAGQQYMGDFPEGKIWVRSAQDVKSALASRDQ